MKRLIEQESCEHGEFVAPGKHYVDGVSCPGGSSREVTVDADSAARAFLPHILWADGSPVTWEDASEAQRDHARDAVAPIVDAALGRGR